MSGVSILPLNFGTFPIVRYFFVFHFYYFYVSTINELSYKNYNSPSLCLNRTTKLLYCHATATIHPLYVHSEVHTGHVDNLVCPFVLFLLDIVLSVLLRYTDTDYPFGIFKLFLLYVRQDRIHFPFSLFMKFRLLPCSRICRSR